MDERVNVTQGDAVMRSAHATKVPQSGYRRPGEPSRRAPRPPQVSWIDRGCGRETARLCRLYRLVAGAPGAVLPLPHGDDDAVLHDIDDVVGVGLTAQSRRNG
jgi:hypothetical protein